MNSASLICITVPYDGNQVEAFKTEVEMWATAEKRGFRGEKKLPKVMEGYKAYWVR